MKRRAFLLGTAAVVGGGLAVGFIWVNAKLSRDATFKLPAAPNATAFNAWLTIGNDGIVTVAVPRQEMGQGVNTMLAMYIAEELDVPLAQIRVIEPPIAPVYGNVVAISDGYKHAGAPALWAIKKIGALAGIQITGGSTSTRDGYLPMRTAAASARTMLIAEAAARWNVEPNTCGVKAGFVEHISSKKRLGFGEIASAAAARSAPDTVVLKPKAQWSVLGTSPPRLDVSAKVDGSAQFGIDVTLPNMVYAAVKHIPMVRGALQQVKWKNGLPPKSVLALAQGEDWIAAISTNTWLAQKALSEAELTGGGAGGCTTSSETLYKKYDAMLDAGGGREYEKRGAIPAEWGAPEPGPQSAPIGRGSTVDVRYRVPFQAHATMEPLNCTVHWRDGQMDIWLGNQSPTLVRWVAAEASGLKSEAITVHTPYLGGGFGRRSDVEVLRQAIACAKVTNGKPVKLTWSREEDIRHDAYRPAVASRMRAVIDESGNVAAWDHTIAGMSVMFDFTRRVAKPMASDAAPDPTNCEGATHLPYAIPNFRVRHMQIDEGVPLGFWRSVGNSYNAFFVETFIDELAAKKQDDPYLFRKALLKNAPRFEKVLDLAASKSGWATALPHGNDEFAGRGIAIAESFASIVAMVVDVRIKGKNIKVERVVAVADCGRALHPNNAAAQIEGAIGFALSASVGGQITLKNGIVEQSNLHDFLITRLPEMPRVEVHFVASDAALGGIGEVGVPPFAPALGNAIFAATGKRLRALPFTL